MDKTIHIRKSAKYKPTFDMLEVLAPHFQNEITATLMEMAKLGIQVYTGEVITKKIQEPAEVTSITTTMSVRREVGRSVFPKLAGQLIDLKRYENRKEHPNPDTVNFYQLAAKALFAQHSQFRHLTDNDVEKVFSTISPILKSCFHADTKEAKEEIIELNKATLLALIKKTGVNNDI
jgi:hypothetical protein